MRWRPWRRIITDRRKTLLRQAQLWAEERYLEEEPTP